LEDKRKNNGGHSTKAKRPDDKRLNKTKSFIDEWISKKGNEEKLQEVFNTLQNMSLAGDIKAINLYLSYVLGKPKETKDITSNGNEIKSPFIIIGTESNKD